MTMLRTRMSARPHFCNRLSLADGQHQAGSCNLFVQALLQRSCRGWVRGEERKNRATCTTNNNLKVHFAYSAKPGPSLETLRTSQPWLNRGNPRCGWRQGSCEFCSDFRLEWVACICPGEGATVQPKLGGCGAAMMGTQPNQAGQDLSTQQLSGHWQPIKEQPYDE